MSVKILAVDDDADLLGLLNTVLTGVGYDVSTADTLAAARKQFGNGLPDIVLCDLVLPDGSGMDLLREIRASNSQANVLVMTAYSSVKSAIEAMREGAYDYISKPFDVDELKLVVAKACERGRLVEENVYLRKEVEQRYSFSNVVGNSPAMQDIFDLVRRVAGIRSTVVIEGESGTGKELIARAIHYAGPRAKKHFVSINCGALPENLLESELFGHERGAFTGAVREKPGLFQEANKGTLFLDEIGEMTLATQVKLLRVLQEKCVRKVGGNREEPIDVRIVAATNRDLREMVESGEFREDLYYRINVIPMRLPPLRHRREDIPLLVDHFLHKCSKAIGIVQKQIHRNALRVLEAYPWPGNVRELENVIERSVALCADETITADTLPAYLVTPGHQATDWISLPPDGLMLEDFIDKARAQLIAQALERTRGVQTKAASLLGMSLRSFRYYAKKAGGAASPPDSDDDEVANG